jgi:hypothetical protein
MTEPCTSLKRCRREQHPRARCKRCGHLECIVALRAGACSCGVRSRRGSYVATADRETWGTVELVLREDR